MVELFEDTGSDDEEFEKGKTRRATHTSKED